MTFVFVFMKDNFSTIKTKIMLVSFDQERDKDAFVVVYHKYHSYLYSLALGYLKNVEAAEEAVQHVFVKLWESTRHIEIESI